jgi:hypothetical protein
MTSPDIERYSSEAKENPYLRLVIRPSSLAYDAGPLKRKIWLSSDLIVPLVKGLGFVAA